MSGRRHPAEERRIVLYEVAQRRRVITHALRYAWRDGTLEVETSMMLALAGVAAAAAELVPEAGWLRNAEAGALAVGLLGLVALVEVLTGGFRNHISQGVGGLVGSPVVRRSDLAAAAVAVVCCATTVMLSLRLWETAGPDVPLPLGVLGGVLGVAASLIGGFRATPRLLFAGGAMAALGLALDGLVAAAVLAPFSGFVTGLFVLAVVPLVSGLLGFHQYRSDVDRRHDDYVADAEELLRGGRVSHRAVAAEALGRLGGLEVVEPLLEALADPDEDVRLSAAFGLAEMRDLVPARLLNRRLDARGYEPGQRVPPEVAHQVEQLATLEWQDAVNARYGELLLGRADLLEGLTDAAGPRQPGPVRRTAARVLAESRVPEALSRLATILLESPEDARAEVSSALALSGAAGAEVLAGLTFGGDDEVRREAGEALLRLVALSRVAYHTRLEQLALDHVLPAERTSGDAEADWLRVRSLARRAFEALSSDPDPRLRDAAKAALELVA